MNKFSVTLFHEKVRMYCFTKDDFMKVIVHFKLYDYTSDILCQTFLGDEITCYVLCKDENKVTHSVFSKIGSTDNREYNVFDIHEDIPGIDHVGIIHEISRHFLEDSIPILYVNTYAHNIVFVADEYMEKAKDKFEKIAYI
jgi:hypothetical protein